MLFGHGRRGWWRGGGRSGRNGRRRGRDMFDGRRGRDCGLRRRYRCGFDGRGRYRRRDPRNFGFEGRSRARLQRNGYESG